MIRPRIVLHIGRNKAGSTTIQDSLRASRDVLAAAGIGYGLFGHLWDSDPALPGWLTFDALAAHAAADPTRVWLVSNEFMSAWDDVFTAEAGRALAACDVTLIAYLRRYDDWIRSAYAEDTRSGANTLDIDGFVAAMAPRTSAMPNLAGWARGFGWDRMQVRAMPRGDLLADVAQVLGLGGPLVRVAARNVAPHWAVIETLRALATRGVTDRAATDPLATLVERHVRDLPGRPYLTPAQASSLRARYAADLATLRGVGQALPDPDATPADPERAHAPSFGDIPPTLRDRILDAAGTTRFARDHPEAAAAAAALRASGADPRDR